MVRMPGKEVYKEKVETMNDHFKIALKTNVNNEN
jgi:hypothetical protein